MEYREIFPHHEEWLTDVDRALADTASRWSEQEVIAKRLEHEEDYDGLLKPAMDKLFVEIGMQSLLWPEDLGGSAINDPEVAMTMAAVLEQVGRADVGIGFILANTFALQSSFGIGDNRDESKLESLKGMFCGEEAAVASLVLPGYGAGSGGPDISGMSFQVRTSKKDGGRVLNSENVRPQCSGAKAALFGVVAGDAEDQPGLFLVREDADGLSRGDQFLKTGLAASINADLVFKDVIVSESDIVFSGIQNYRALMSRYYLCCASVCMGAMIAGWEILKEWGETRVIKGKGQTFKDNPLVASLMGEIGFRLNTSRMMLYGLARVVSKPDIYGRPGDPKVFTTSVSTLCTTARSAMDSLNNAMEMMASAGYATEWQIERYWRDVKTMQTYLGPQMAAQMDAARYYFGYQEAGGFDR